MNDKNKIIKNPGNELMDFQNEFLLEMKKNEMMMKKIELDFEQETSKMKMMKDVEIARIRAPIFQEAIKSGSEARRYFVQTLTEDFVDDPLMLSIYANRGKITKINNHQYFAVTCPICNRETFDIPKAPGNYRYKCRNKFMLFETPWVQVDIGYNGSISVKGK